MKLFFIVFISLAAQAGTLDPCTNLGEYTCSHRTSNDGTGKAKNPFGNSFAVYREALESARRLEVSNLSDELVKPSNAKVLQLAYDGLGIKARHKDCPEATECIPFIADALSRHMRASVDKLRELQDSGEMGVFGDVSAWDALKNTALYQKAQTSIAIHLANATDHASLVEKTEKEVFPALKKILKEKLNTWVSDPGVRLRIEHKIDAIVWGGTNCDKSIVGRGSEIMPNGYYDGEAKPPAVTLCKGFFLNATSLYAVSMALGHELAHALGPCEIGEEYTDLDGIKQTAFIYQHKGAFELEEAQKEYPLKNLVSCLRSEKSLHVSESDGFLFRATKKMVGWVSNAKGYDTKPFCKTTDIDEASADWVGNELMNAYMSKITATQQQRISGYANSMSLLCDPPPTTIVGELWDHNHHAEQVLRVNAIVGVNPIEREQMGCSSPPKEQVYCSPQTNSASKTSEPGVAK